MGEKDVIVQFIKMFTKWKGFAAWGRAHEIRTKDKTLPAQQIKEKGCNEGLDVARFTRE